MKPFKECRHSWVSIAITTTHKAATIECKTLMTYQREKLALKHTLSHVVFFTDSLLR
jgi:hypothetical protein